MVSRSCNLEKPVPSGQSVLDLEYDAPSATRTTQGLYRVDAGGDSYAFTQFEAISARNAFPCFDEPGFKTPFELWVTVPADDVAASNTKVIAYDVTGDEKRVHFAQTEAAALRTWSRWPWVRSRRHRCAARGCKRCAR